MSYVGYGSSEPTAAQRLEAMRLQQQMQAEQQKTARMQIAEQSKTDRERAEREAIVASRQASADSFSRMMQAQQQQAASESAAFQQMMSSMTAPRAAVPIPGMQRRGPSGLAIGLSIGGVLLLLGGIAAVVALKK